MLCLTHARTRALVSRTCTIQDLGTVLEKLGLSEAEVKRITTTAPTKVPHGPPPHFLCLSFSPLRRLADNHFRRLQNGSAQWAVAS